MPGTSDDRDRDRERDDRTLPNIYKIDKEIALLAQKFEALDKTVSSGFEATRRQLEDVISRYATKADLEIVDKQVKALQNWNSWAIKGVLTAIFVAVMTLIFKSGLLHT